MLLMASIYFQGYKQCSAGHVSAEVVRRGSGGRGRGDGRPPHRQQPPRPQCKGKPRRRNPTKPPTMRSSITSQCATNTTKS